MRGGEPTEHEIQSAFFDWVGLQKHRAFFVCFAVPNGSYKSRSAANKFQREGLRPGVPDVLMLYPNSAFHGLALEFKTKTGRVSDSQFDMQSRLRGAGYRVEVVRSVDEAILIVEDYLNL